jgi:WD40 repeat protein
MLIILISLFPDVKSDFMDFASTAQSLNDFIPEKATYDYDMISNIDCSPDNKYVAFGCVIDNSIVLWDKKRRLDHLGIMGFKIVGKLIF